MRNENHELAGFPPKVFLIGAQKAGTTFLANLLDQHPEIQLASPKEPHYFTRYRHAELEWYRGCFDHNEGSRILLDASPSYSAAPTSRNELESGDDDNPYANVPARIKNVSPDARFLYLVRDPVARIYSGYWHAFRTGVERRSFLEAISLETHYRRVSDYGAQLSLYLEQFPPDRFLILRFEDLVQNPAEAVWRCTEFLNLEPINDLETEQGKHRSFVYSRTAQALTKVLPFLGLAGIARTGRRFLPDSIVRWAEAVLTSRIPPMDPDVREDLLEEYRQMAEAFESETGVRLYPWAADESVSVRGDDGT